MVCCSSQDGVDAGGLSEGQNDISKGGRWSKRAPLSLDVNVDEQTADLLQSFPIDVSYPPFLNCEYCNEFI